ncbi:MAG: hypothetical protein EOP51_01440 [Sphingobacteriales bacterium]|nr:MAG: hypothetical protein EOP51_01440 [Sphingobacteriales bacterium]
MAFFLGLVLMYGILWLLSLAGIHSLSNHMLRGAYAAGIMFILIGVAHFAKPEMIEAYLPKSWPYKRAMNFVSGFFEVAFGVGLFFQATRTYSAWGLLLLLIAVFPANINMAIVKPNFSNIFRLFFQPVYMFWVYWFCLR